MPIGLVSDDDLQKEIESLNGTPKTVVKGQVSKLHPQGRKEGDMNVPDPLRQIIGETAVIDGRQAALSLASEFGVSASSVSAYAKGATSTASYDTPTKSIIGHINKSRARATKKASKVLNAALEAISQDKLDYADATDLSGIAKDMSVIIKNLEPTAEVAATEGSKPQFVIFAPTFKDERSYDTITVQE